MSHHTRGELRTPASCSSCRCPFHRDGETGFRYCGRPDNCVPWIVTGHTHQPLYPLGGSLTIPLCPSCVPGPDGPSPCSAPSPGTWSAAREGYPGAVLPREPPTHHTAPSACHVWQYQAPNPNPRWQPSSTTHATACQRHASCGVGRKARALPHAAFPSEPRFAASGWRP